MQEKIPQEVNVEDKIVGPFTLKQFGFVFTGTGIAVTVMAIFMKLGLDTVPSIIIGGFFGSFALVLGFFPFNGRPLYVYTMPLISFLTKPRQRIWKKTTEGAPAKERAEEATSQIAAMSDMPSAPQKKDLKSIEREIEDLSLTVDTKGLYGISRGKTADSPDTVFDRGIPAVDEALEKNREKNPATAAVSEPTVSELASIDPNKKFEYEKPDTSRYKIEDMNK